MFISYNRNAFFCKDHPDFRVTFDSRVLTRRNHLHLEEGSWRRKIPYGSKNIRCLTFMVFKNFI